MTAYLDHNIISAEVYGKTCGSFLVGLSNVGVDLSLDLIPQVIGWHAHPLFAHNASLKGEWVKTKCNSKSIIIVAKL